MEILGRPKISQSRLSRILSYKNRDILHNQSRVKLSIQYSEFQLYQKKRENFVMGEKDNYRTCRKLWFSRLHISQQKNMLFLSVSLCVCLYESVLDAECMVKKTSRTSGSLLLQSGFGSSPRSIGTFSIQENGQKKK